MDHMRKIGIIGAGHVGSHLSAALLFQDLCEELVLLDIDREKAKAQADDLQDMAVLTGGAARVRAGDYADLADAGFIVVCVSGTTGKEDRLDELEASVRVIDEIIPELLRCKFGGVLLVITNPVDVVTRYLASKLNLPVGRVFGSGTTLDTSRQVRALSRRAGVNQQSIRGMVLGEHGESQAHCWSQVTVDGVPIRQRMESDPVWQGFDLAAVEEETRGTAWKIFCGKGSTEFGIGLSAARIIQAIQKDEGLVLPVSAPLDGRLDGVYISLPCVLGKNGVEKILRPALSPDEQRKFDASRARMEEIWQTIPRG